MRRSPLQRQTPLRATSTLKASLPVERKVRQRKCAIRTCREPFTPRSMTHKTCGPDCALALVEQDKAKTVRKEKKAALNKLKTRRDYLKEAQVAFNAFIRMRDQLAGHACISSGRPLDWSGNAVDAGHYRSVGSAPHLRFNEDNCHAQSKHDNQWKSGNAVDYRIGLIARIGLARVEALEADNEPRKYTAEQLIAIRDEYRAKLRELKKQKAIE